MVPSALAMDPHAGPILKDGLYYGFWMIVLTLGSTFAAVVVYLLWEILQALKGR